MEDQLKRIRESHQDVWDHDLAIVKSEWKHALAKDQDSFEMCNMTVRTDQLLHITETVDSQVHHWGSEAETDGMVKKLRQSLKQYHTRFHYFYEKGSNRAIIGLHRLHPNDVFWCLNVPASVGVKSFCPWCFKLGGYGDYSYPLDGGAL